MAFSKKTILMLFLVAFLFIGMAAASERQPLFADSISSSSRQLPMRFQEMIRRRKLAQAGSYGARPAPAGARYGTGVYGVYGR